MVVPCHTAAFGVLPFPDLRGVLRIGQFVRVAPLDFVSNVVAFHGRGNPCRSLILRESVCFLGASLLLMCLVLRMATYMDMRIGICMRAYVSTCMQSFV